MHQRRLRSAKQSREQDLNHFVETFNRFETALAKCQQPEVRSKHKLLLFERQTVSRIRNRSILSEDDKSVRNSLPFQQCVRSVRPQSAKGYSLEHIFRNVSVKSTLAEDHRYKKPADEWQSSCHSMLSALYRAKCKDMKVDRNSKQEKIFISRLEGKLTKRKFICPENGFGLGSARVIESFIRQSPSLIVLVLDRNCLGDEAVKVIAAALPHSSLIKLSLVSTNMSWSGAIDVLHSLYLTNTLTEISLASCQGLYRNKLGYDGVRDLQNILKKVETLHCLDLSGSGITTEGWRAVCEGMAANRSMCSLSVAKNELRSEVFAATIPKLAMCALEKLDVSRNNFQDQGVMALSEIVGGSQNRKCLASSLRILDLSDCGITSLGLESLCRQLIKNFTLERLYLDSNNLSKGNHFQIFRLLLQSTKSINYLSMRNVSLEQDDFLYVSEGMESNTSLQELDLSENYLERTACLQLCQFIKHNRILRVLHLTKCNIPDEGVAQLANYIDQNRTLEKLYLEHNFIKDAGARHLQQLLTRNPQLTVLHLEKNMLSLQSQRDIKKLLEQNMLVATLGQPNMLSYELKKEDNDRRSATLRETIVELQRRYEETYRRRVIDDIVYYDCAIEDARKRLQLEHEKLAVAQTIGSFYATS